MLSTVPRWLTLKSSQLTPTLGGWLLDKGSLTRRLTALANGDFAVHPLKEGWQTLRADECDMLDVPPASYGWVREVYLLGAGKPWIFARSVATKTALAGNGFDLSQLGNRSLGELLFCQQDFIRDTIELCRYPASLLPPEVRVDGLWGRRSCFRKAALCVLVAEIWLPQLLAEIKPG